MAPRESGWRVGSVWVATSARAVLVAAILAGCSQLGCAGVAGASPNVEAASQEGACADQPGQPGHMDQPGVTPAVPGAGDQDAATLKLEGRLAAVAAQASSQSVESALGAAEAAGLTVVGGAIRVVVESATPDLAGARAAVVAAGGTVEAEYADVIQALLPPTGLEQVARSPDVRYVRAPAQAVPGRRP